MIKIGFYYQKQKQFRDMEAKSEKRKISVFRNGVLSEIPDTEIMVGDVLDIHQGNQIPCDGLCIMPIGGKIFQFILFSKFHYIFFFIPTYKYFICFFRSTSF